MSDDKKQVQVSFTRKELLQDFELDTIKRKKALIEARRFLSEGITNGADLTGSLLIDSDMTRTTLTGADLRGANLAGADIREANMTGVKR